MRQFFLFSVLLAMSCCGVPNNTDESPNELQHSTSLAELRKKQMQATSPDGQLNLAFTRSGDGKILYELSMNGTTLISPSSLGFTLRSQGKESKDFAIEAVKVTQSSESYNLPWGIVDQVNAPYTELQLSLKHVPKKFKFKLEARVFDDGIGIRYVFPRQMNLSFPKDTMRIIEEHTEFNIVGDPLVNWGPGDWASHENPLELTLRSQINATKYNALETLPEHKVPNNAVMTPVSMHLKGGVHLSIHEAGPTDYPEMTLAVTPTGFITILEGTESRVAKAVVKLPFNTPWRTIAVEDRAIDLVTNMLAVSLSDSNSYLRNPYRFNKMVAPSIATEYDTLNDYSQASKLTQLSSIAYTRGLDSPYDFSARFGSIDVEGKSEEEIQLMLGAFVGACVILHAPAGEKLAVPAYLDQVESEVKSVNGTPIPLEILQRSRQNTPLHRYVKEVATAWDNAYPLAGELGQYLALARKVKGRDEYFIGGVTADQDQELAVPLNFLQDSISYEFSLIDATHDNSKNDGMLRPTFKNSFVRRGDTINITMKKGSGFGGIIGMGVAE